MKKSQFRFIMRLARVFALIISHPECLVYIFLKNILNILHIGVRMPGGMCSRGIFMLRDPPSECRTYPKPSNAPQSASLTAPRKGASRRRAAVLRTAAAGRRSLPAGDAAASPAAADEVRRYFRYNQKQPRCRAVFG